MSKRPHSGSSGHTHRPHKQRKYDDPKRSEYQHFLPNVADQKTKKTKKRSNFLHQAMFLTQLPDPPMQPKFLKVPFQANVNRLVEYCSAALEKAVKPELLCDRLLGVPLDIIDRDQYARPPHVARDVIPEADRALLPGAKQRKTSAAEHNLLVMRSELLELHHSGHRFISSQRVAKKKMDLVQEQQLQKKREERLLLPNQKKAIEEAFEAAHEVPIHPTNPARRAVSVVPLFPEGSHSHCDFTQVNFKDAPGRMLKRDLQNPDFRQYNDLEGTPETLLSNAFFMEQPDERIGHPHWSLYLPHRSIPEGEDGLISNQALQWVREYEQLPNKDHRKGFTLRITEDEAYYRGFSRLLNLRKLVVTTSHGLASAVAQKPRIVSLRTKTTLTGGPSPASSPDPLGLFHDSDHENDGGENENENENENPAADTADMSNDEEDTHAAMVEADTQDVEGAEEEEEDDTTRLEATEVAPSENFQDAYEDDVVDE